MKARQPSYVDVLFFSTQWKGSAFEECNSALIGKNQRSRSVIQHSGERISVQGVEFSVPEVKTEKMSKCERAQCLRRKNTYIIEYYFAILANGLTSTLGRIQ